MHGAECIGGVRRDEYLLEMRPENGIERGLVRKRRESGFDFAFGFAS